VNPRPRKHLFFLNAVVTFVATAVLFAGGLPPEFALGTESYFAGSVPDSVAAKRAFAALDVEMSMASDSCERNVIAAHLRLAETWWQSGRMDSAEVVFKSAVARARRCLPPEDSLRIKAQYCIGAYFADAGFYQIDDAIPYLRDAVAGCDNSEWCKGTIRALLLRQTALALEFVGDSTSRSMLRESLRLFESVDKPDSSEVARSLWLLRKSLFEGQYREEAHQILERLLLLIDSQPKLAFPSRGTVLSAYGEDLHFAGDDARAVPYLRDALDEFDVESMMTECRTARTYGLLATCLSSLGRFEEAKPYYEQSILTYKDCGELNPPYFYIASSVAYGKDLIDHGCYDQALDVLTTAQGIANDSLGRGEDAHAYLLLELARLYDLTGRTRIAEEYYGHALAIAENIHSFVDPRVSNFLEPLAEFYFEHGHLLQALPMQARSQKLREARYGIAHPLVAESLHRLSFMTRKSETSDYRLLDQIHVAGWWQLQAWEIRLEQLRDALAILPEHQLIQLSDRLQTEAARTYSMLADLPEDNSLKTLAARIIPASKAQVWDALQSRKQLLATEHDAYIKSLSDSLVMIRQELATSYVSLRFTDNWEEYLERTSRLAERKSQLTEELSFRSASFERSNYRFDPQAFMISSVMPKNSVLVDFIRYEHDLSLRRSEPRYLALVILPDSSATLISLGSAVGIDSLTSLYTEEFANPYQLDEADFARSSRALFDRIWAPVATLTRGASQVFVCPDGSLNGVSFETLLDSGNQFLVETHVFQYLSSGRELYRIMTQAPAPEERSSGLLAIGNPDFDAYNVEILEDDLASLQSKSEIANSKNISQSGVRSRSGTLSREVLQTEWTRLPASQNEISIVESLWTENCADTAVVLSGGHANEESFKHFSNGKRVVYLATHGYSNDRVEFASMSNGTENIASPDLLIDNNPLLQSGVVLAGANTRGQEPSDSLREDGVVTAEEIACLDLRGVELVILSVCHGSNGMVIDGEGVYSLRRAFELAGAKTVISSLWAIDDNASAALMTSMVDKSSNPAPVALHDAMLERINVLRGKGASDHPYYWAGYICSGDPRTRLFSVSKDQSLDSLASPALPNEESSRE
jgi:CHAT domain-containing protein/tetratricopeptide (TPR) repeat protein